MAKNRNNDILIQKRALKNTKNITKLFTLLDTTRALVISDLNLQELSAVIELKKKFLAYIEKMQESQRTELKNEAKLARNLTDLDLTPESLEYDDFELYTKLNEENYLERPQLVKILKFEKFKRKSKSFVNDVKSVLEMYMSKKSHQKTIFPLSEYEMNINEFSLNNDSKVISSVLASMATNKVSTAKEKAKGTQVKILMDLVDGTKVMIKPQKVPRNYETPPDHFYFVDFERHHAEIAAFHVDKLLNFYRCPPTVGRVFDMTEEILKNANQPLAKTFFVSPAGNTCFTGHCSYYCDSTHATCGKPRNRLEASVQLMLPNKPVVKWSSTQHPYRRSYSKRKKAEWESNDNYCQEQVFQDTELQGKILLDLMDMSIFDFIIGNMDRHHYEKMDSLGNETFLLHLDHGRAFGRQYSDEMSILVPVRQCCLVRFTTLERLRYLWANNFAKMLDDSMKLDPLYPILTMGHLVAVERRLCIVLNELSQCVEKFQAVNVIIDDGY